MSITNEITCVRFYLNFVPIKVYIRQPPPVTAGVEGFFTPRHPLRIRAEFQRIVKHTHCCDPDPVTPVSANM